MLLKVLDGNGIPQTLVTAAQEAPTDGSDTIVATGVAQPLLVANSLRSGWLMQNRGSNPMYVNELATSAVAVAAGDGAFVVPVNGYFPPPGFPVSTGAVSIMGTIGDGFALREW